MRVTDDSGVTRCSEGSEKGVLPSILTDLITKRGEVKSILKKKTRELNHTSPGQNDRLKEEVSQLNTEQLAIKLVANSMYGCLGFSHARFFAKPLASFITNMGRNILQRTIDKTNEIGFEIIYGDTDSIMVNANTSDPREALVTADQIVSVINQSGSYLELELDYVFSKMLLLRKKKYAALQCVFGDNNVIRETKLEVKGIDLVRRDWCQLSKIVSNDVLNVIFSQSTDDPDCVDMINHKIIQILKDLCAALHNNQIPIEQLIIHKELKSAPEDYPNKDLPHVAVALRMKELGYQVSSHSVIPYVVALLPP
ncbi:hypothetical protein GEMRC1_007922 [Eukaryota sp. GEM-RC1]